MITKNDITLLKEQYQKEADYFGNIDFLIISEKFQGVVKILTEIEELLEENEKMKARLQAMEEEASQKLLEPTPAQEEGATDAV